MRAAPEIERQAGRMLVTGVGGASGLAVAQHARLRNPEVWWADADPECPAILLQPERAVIVPRVSAATYAGDLLAICNRLGVSMLSPNVDVEIVAAVDLAADLQGAGVRTWVPDRSTLDVCVDKVRFAEFVRTHTRLRTPNTWTDLEALPTTTPEAGLIVKPRIGSGARGVHACFSRLELDAARVLVADSLVQERIVGQEFSADAISLPGRPSLVHLRKRVKVKAGMSVVAESFVDEEVAGAVSALLAALEFSGPSCVQGFLTASGPIFTEVNIRFGGGCGLAQDSGGRLLDRYLSYLITGHYDVADFGYAAGHRLIRTFEGVTLDRKEL